MPDEVAVGDHMFYTRRMAPSVGAYSRRPSTHPTSSNRRPSGNTLSTLQIDEKRHSNKHDIRIVLGSPAASQSDVRIGKTTFESANGGPLPTSPRAASTPPASFACVGGA